MFINLVLDPHFFDLLISKFMTLRSIWELYSTMNSWTNRTLIPQKTREAKFRRTHHFAKTINTELPKNITFPTTHFVDKLLVPTIHPYLDSWAWLAPWRIILTSQPNTRPSQLYHPNLGNRRQTYVEKQVLLWIWWHSYHWNLLNQTNQFLQRNERPQPVRQNVLANLSTLLLLNMNKRTPIKRARTAAADNKKTP